MKKGKSKEKAEKDKNQLLYAYVSCIFYCYGFGKQHINMSAMCFDKNMIKIARGRNGKIIYRSR